ncbi:MAG: nucleotidyltransferase domain-containing protein [Gemmataceae bacterium]
MISTNHKEQLKDFVVSFAEGFPQDVLDQTGHRLPYNIVGGVFYGSLVQGEFRTYSDIDLGIIIDSNLVDREEPTENIRKIQRDWLLRRIYQDTSIDRVVQITVGPVSMLRPGANKAWSEGQPWGIGFLVADHDTEFVMRTPKDIRDRFKSVIRDGVPWAEG